ncbi:hypothetical protein ACFSM5_16185 [Lacibacterium aquatile]|uniref:Molecular chaperone n=1 Tax=Lacibacterium aquatile TaxID=1168082 RepID=A0ABW5DVE6_9PROT
MKRDIQSTEAGTDPCAGLGRLRRQMLFGMILGLTLALLPLLAQAEILITPGRVHLDERRPAATITLSNSADGERSYTLALVSMVMQEDGTVRESETPPAFMNDFRDELRFSPQSLTLQPGETQTVRVALKRAKRLSDGDYHIHMRVSVEAPEQPADTGEEQAVGVQVRFNIGVALPILYRQGQIEATGTLDALRLDTNDPGAPFLEARLERKGNGSLYGDVLVLSGDKPIGRLNGVAVYTEIAARRLQIPLAALPSGPLTLRYQTPKDQGEKVMAERSLQR